MSTTEDPAPLKFRPLLYAGPFLILALAAAYLGMRWGEIPDRFPIHWGVSGEVDGWGTRSFFGVFGILLVGVVESVMLVGSAAMIRSIRRASVSGVQAAHDARFRRGIEVMVLVLGWLLTISIAWLGVWLPFRDSTQLPLSFILLMVGGIGLITVVIVVYAIRMGKVSQRMEKESPGERAPDECWKWGVFYCNPADPELWVAKRRGIGWTLNMARPAARWILGGLLMFVLVDILVVLLIAFASSRG